MTEGEAAPDNTISGELTLSNNRGQPVMEGIQGGVQSDPGAGSFHPHLFPQGMYKWFGKAL